MNGAPLLDSLPLTLLTGFLGSGKTTLLRRALTDPAFSDTAVVINEIGEIAIDHYLVDFVEGEVLELPGGCLCCAVREDLAETLRSLIERRDAGDIRRFGRIVVETSGLADPGPILFTLGADPMLDQRLRLARVVTLVDAVTGADDARPLRRGGAPGRDRRRAGDLENRPRAVRRRAARAPRRAQPRRRADRRRRRQRSRVGAVRVAAAPPPQPSPASGGGGRRHNPRSVTLPRWRGRAGWG